jgi:hypothetical protein
MGRTYDDITPELREWIEEQKLFFVATAPHDGHVNVSPKGYDTFRIIDGTTVAYLDLTGSGAETLAHIRQNGRITFLFCAFDGKPRIVRLHGAATGHPDGTPEFDELRPLFPDRPGARAVVRATLDRVSTSCGYSIPLYDYVGDRTVLDERAERRGRPGIVEYWAENNTTSIDGLPALEAATGEDRGGAAV